MNPVKYIFVDIDETLLHTQIKYGRKKEEIVLQPDERAMHNWGHPYVAKLRPGAHELLRRLRAISPGNVFALTTSTKDYAEGFTAQFEFGFAPEDIFPRERLRDGPPLDLARFPNGRAYLIDDRSEYEQYEKIHFLAGIGGERFQVRYIRVQEFFGDDSQGFTPEELDRIIGLVEN